MLLRILFFTFVLFMIKQLIIKFNYKDYFNISLTLLILFFGIFYILGYSKVYIFISMFIASILIIYSYFSKNVTDNSIIIIDGYIDFKNMYKNKYSITSLLEDLKKQKQNNLNEDMCAVLKNKKLTIYSKDNYNKVIPLIIEGSLDNIGLSRLSKSYEWINNILDINKCELKEVTLAFYYNRVVYIIKK